ncbi:MAG TPA: hypothetical protein VH704_04230, partial [Casimicrobiaceae bacterium]|nr:hypothetical protein [Casimicrobiaceae bacterium]
MTRCSFPPALVRVAAIGCCCAFACMGAAAQAALSDRANDAGCSSKPTLVEGSMYKCTTRTGNIAYFNVPGAVGSTSRAPTPAGFPKVDAGTQKGRDILRNKVLTDELATEEKLLAEARAAYGDGTPPPLPDEKANAQKYADRLARLRQAVALHEKNIEALKRELAA